MNNFDGVAGDGGVYASARDLHRWHQALLTGKLLPHSEYRRALASGTLADGSETGYGYGWFLRNETVVDHAGSWVGLWHHKRYPQGQRRAVFSGSLYYCHVSSDFRLNGSNSFSLS